MNPISGRRGYRPRRRRLYFLSSIGALLSFVVALTLALLDRSQEAERQNRNKEISDLFSVKTPRIKIGAPGAVAWLDQKIWEETGAKKRLRDPGAPGDEVPDYFRPIEEVLETMAFDLETGATASSKFKVETSQDLTFRSHGVLRYESDPTLSPAPCLAFTRRSEPNRFDDWNTKSNQFMSLSAPYIINLGEQLRKLDPGSPRGSARANMKITGYNVVRVYAVSHRGAVLSHPLWHSCSGESEGLSVPKFTPTVLLDSFYFRFDFDALSEGRSGQAQLLADDAWSSGFYIDFGGYGLVTTLVVPLVRLDDDLRMVIGVDIALSVDWSQFLKDVDFPVVQVVEVDPPGTSSVPSGDPDPGWSPWELVLQELREVTTPKDPGILDVLGKITPDLDRQPMYHYVEGEESQGEEGQRLGDNSIALFRVGKDLATDSRQTEGKEKILIVYFPASGASSAWVMALAALAAFLGFLLAFSLYKQDERREFQQRAERARQKAKVKAEEIQEIARAEAEETQEKTNAEFESLKKLVSTMRIPIATVDPDGDVAVSSNEAAASLGIEPGKCIENLIAEDDSSSLKHYRAMHQPSDTSISDEATSGAGKIPRAYGVRLRLNGTDTHAVIRSVGVKQPLKTLKATAGHRLGIFFMLDPEKDLKVYDEERRKEFSAEERRRLAKLFSHGVETSSAVLSKHVSALRESGRQADDFSKWLANHLTRRLGVIEWLLYNWDRPGGSRSTSRGLFQASYVRDLLSELQLVFQLVGRDSELRRQLHWDGGSLNENSADSPVFDQTIIWPKEYGLECPVQDGIAFFLEELLVNAIKHGSPGAILRPNVTITLKGDSALSFKVTNETTAKRKGGDENGVRRQQEEGREAEAHKASRIDAAPYGGTELLGRLAYLFEWNNLEFDESKKGIFTVSWQAQLSEIQSGWRS